jgi:hypothetical protein
VGRADLDELSPPVPVQERAGTAVHLVVLGVYLALALWVTGPLWSAPGAVNPAANTSDPAFFEAALLHATRIFTHGENPFLTPMVNAPLGVNMMANTGLLGLAVPLVPVTLLFGPSVSLDLLLTLGLAATAAGWYAMLCRGPALGLDQQGGVRQHVTRSRLAAAVGGGFAGFAPGLVNHTNAHPNLVAQFLIPFIVWGALSMRTVRRGVLVGLLVTWQALINEELLFFTAIALVVFVAGYAASRPGEVRAAAQGFLTALAAAVLTAGILLAYPLVLQFAGPQHYRGLPDFVRGYGTDLASYGAFPKLSLAHGDGTLAPQPEENTFFGWPLLLVLLAIVVWLWRRPAVRALTLVGAVFAALSLGPAVVYHGHQVAAHAPWDLLKGLPLFDTVVPIRLGLVVIPVVAVLLALGVDAVVAARRLWLLVPLVALLPILPARLPVTPQPAVPTFFTDGTWRRYVSGNESVVSADQTVWYGGIIAMRWDNATRLGYRTVGGYFLGPDANGRGGYGTVPRPTAALLAGVAYNGGVPTVGPDERAAAVADVRYWRAAVVVLAPDAPHGDDLHNTLDLLFGQGRAVSDVWLWDVRPLLT